MYSHSGQGSQTCKKHNEEDAVIVYQEAERRRLQMMLFKGWGRVNRKEALGQNILCDSLEEQDLPETSPLRQGESQENAPCFFSLLCSHQLSLPLLSYIHCHIFSILEHCLTHADACHGLNCVSPCPIPKSHVEILYAVCSIAKSCLALL